MMDVEFKDINGNHVGLDLNSMVLTRVGDLGVIDVDLKNGDLVNSWVDYTGSTGSIKIYVSYSNLKPKEPVVPVTFDIADYIDNNFMFVGFSGSTQASTEIQSIEWWSFTSSFDETPSSSTQLPLVPQPSPTANLMNPTVDTVNPPPPSAAPAAENVASPVEASTEKRTSRHVFCSS